MRPSDDELRAAAELLNTAESVTILAGAGCQRAHGELVALATRLKAPVVHSLRGKDFVEYENPCDVGMTGPLGFTSGYRAMEHCDVLLIVGTDFPYRPFYPERARVIQVDVRGEQIGRRVRVDLGLVGTVKDTIGALLPGLRDDRDATHLARMRSHYRRTRERLDADAKSYTDRAPVHPQLTAAAIDRLAADDAVFVAGVGPPTLWAARHLHMNGRRRLIGCFHHGTLGNALRQAIGVQTAHPGRQVVTLCVDGGLAPRLIELRTLRQRQLPVKVVVLSHPPATESAGETGADHAASPDTDLVTARVGETGADHAASPDTDLVTLRLADAADAIGIHGLRIGQPSELEDGLRRGFAREGPVLIEVLTPRQWLSLPPSLPAAHATSASWWDTRSLLSDQGDEVFELFKTNLHDLASE